MECPNSIIMSTCISTLYAMLKSLPKYAYIFPLLRVTFSACVKIFLVTHILVGKIRLICNNNYRKLNLSVLKGFFFATKFLNLRNFGYDDLFQVFINLQSGKSYILLNFKLLINQKWLKISEYKIITSYNTKLYALMNKKHLQN